MMLSMVWISNHSSSSIKISTRQTSRKPVSARVEQVGLMKRSAHLVQCVYDQDWKKQVRQKITLHAELIKMKKKSRKVLKMHRFLLYFGVRVRMPLKQQRMYWNCQHLGKQ